MSDVDPTPTTPVTIGDRLAWFRGDLVQRILTAVAELRGPNNATLSTLLSEDQYDTQSQLQNGILSDIKSPIVDLRDGWNYGLGMTPYALMDSIYMLLADMSNNIEAMTLSLVATNEGQPPALTVDDIGSINAVQIEGRNFATFVETPDGGISVAADMITISPEPGDWDGWSAYLQTTALEPWQAGYPVPANQWFSMNGGYYSTNFSVPVPSPIRAFLRKPPAALYQLISERITTNTSAVFQGIVWPEIYNPTIIRPGSTVTYSHAIFARALGGYTITNLGPITVTVYRYTTNGQWAALANLVVGQSYVVSNSQPENSAITVQSPNNGNTVYTISVQPSA